MLLLIPKVEDETEIKHFRSISLANYYKIVSKMLTNRLKQAMGDMVDEINRHLFWTQWHSVTLAEAIAFLKDGHADGLLVKINFEKAFDTVDWDFLLDALMARDISHIFVGGSRNI